MEEVRRVDYKVEHQRGKLNTDYKIWRWILIATLITFPVSAILNLIYDDSFTLFLLWTSIIMIPILIIVSNQRNKDVGKYIESQIQQYHEDLPYEFDKYDFITYLQTIAYSEKDKLLVISKRQFNDDKLVPTIVRFDDIVSVEVQKDGVEFSKIKKGDMIGKTLVGGALFGGVGVVIGAVGSDRKHIEEVSNLKLLIRVRDLRSPIIEIEFLNKKKDNVESYSEQFLLQQKEKLNEWYYRLQNIIID